MRGYQAQEVIARLDAAKEKEKGSLAAEITIELIPLSCPLSSLNDPYSKIYVSK